MFLFDKQSPDLAFQIFSDKPGADRPVGYTIREAEGQNLKDNRIGGLFYAGVIKSLLNYMGFECDDVDYVSDSKQGAYYRIRANIKYDAENVRGK